uniref:Toxin candidate TRINITY_DN38706_c0_g2_i1 n=1 Tax=Pachycerianthus maua TaxID=2736681 RepID=A0A7G7WZ19_9CNID|nr:toxin candidate TRINITY_DN38706_c0_g2_i1 [Pachycerianthus maua]
MSKTTLVAVALWFTLVCSMPDKSSVGDKRYQDRKITSYKELLGYYRAAMKDQCKYLKELDGCSLPSDLITQFRDVLTPACFRHDVCYRCAAYYNWSKEKCDEAFLKDMKDICTQRQHTRSFWTLFNRDPCLTTAEQYHTGVKVFGFPYYGKEPRKWCSLNCAENGGNPHYIPDTGHILNLVDFRKLP